MACRVGLAVETISRVPGDETKDGQRNQKASPAYSRAWMGGVEIV